MRLHILLDLIEFKVHKPSSKIMFLISNFVKTKIIQSILLFKKINIMWFMDIIRLGNNKNFMPLYNIFTGVFHVSNFSNI